MVSNKLKLAIIIVLYKTSLDKSLTFLSIMKLPLEIRSQISVIVYENAADPIFATVEECSSFMREFAAFEYIRNAENGGVAPAYNYALQQALKNKITWLLLLDQDTELTLNYFNELCNFLASEKQMAVAFVPKIAQGKKIFTPVGGLLKHAVTASGYFTISNLNYLNTISSGLLLSVEFINSLGGFDSRFWLDGLDHWLFCMMLKQNSRIFIGNSILQHNLSVKSKGYVSFERYANILDSENLLYLECWTAKQRIVYILTLLYRSAKFVIKTHRFKYSIRTLTQLFLCLFPTKRTIN